MAEEVVSASDLDAAVNAALNELSAWNYLVSYGSALPVFYSDKKTQVSNASVIPGSFDSAIQGGRVYIARWVSPPTGGEVQRFTQANGVDAFYLVNTAPPAGTETRWATETQQTVETRGLIALAGASFTAGVVTKTPTSATTAYLTPSQISTYGTPAGNVSFSLVGTPTLDSDCTQPGGHVTVSCKVKNSGSIAGSAVIYAKLQGGITYQSDSFTVNAGATASAPPVLVFIPSVTYTEEVNQEICVTVSPA